MRSKKTGAKYSMTYFVCRDCGYLGLCVSDKERAELNAKADAQQIATGNAGWRLQFAEKSLVGGCHRSRVPELWTLGCMTRSENINDTKL